MTRFILKYRLLLLVVFVIGCKGLSPYDKSCKNLVRGFPYRHYIGKKFGEFYRDFKAKADTRGIETICNLYYPKPGMVGGTQLQLGKGYKISARTNSKYYTPNYSDTIPKCYECSCIQNDTAKITGFELSKNNQIIRTYKK